MNYQLITEALQPINKPLGGYRPRIERDNLDGYGSPEGCIYVEDLPRPTETPDGQRWTRATPTLEGYGWELVEVEEAPEDATNAALKAWWSSLTIPEQVSIYTHAKEAILAWERGEIEVMIHLVLANQAPELGALKAQVQAMLGD